MRARIRKAGRALIWALVVPVVRVRARRRLSRLVPGAVTVVTVNWNSRDYLRTLLRLVPRRSPGDVRILVVDNDSRDGSRELLAGLPDVRLLGLPVNLGHDLALDLGFLSVETEFVVALDVDAFPVHDRWLDELLGPLHAGSAISGARLNRQYVHPCCLAMRTERFVRRRHSFREHYRPRKEGIDASGDIGEELSGREAGNLHFFDPTSQRGPGDIGTVFGGLVYHNFYSTRFSATRADVLDGRVHRDDPVAAWHEALDRYAD
jgi:glycosyltransferase involved in cell wall biosynthesis